MRLTHRLLILAAAAAACLTAGHLLTGDGAARAAGAGCSAHMAGLQTSRKTPVEVVVFNGSGVELTLDLHLRDAAGDTVLDRPDAIVIGSFETQIVSLEAELSRDLAKKQKPYEGLVAIELSGEAPFSEELVIVHATQYFGKTKKPRAAVLFRPLFRSDD